MTISHLGRLKRVEIRDFGLSASDFAAWLARKENLAVLGDTLGIDLELEQQHRPLEGFGNILCRDTGTGRWVLIKCQLERTHNSDLGQLMATASNLEATTIVWISAGLSKEHCSALDWLNKITGPSFLLLGLEVELWQIGDSPAAPKFDVVSKPRGWTPSVAAAAPTIGDWQRVEAKWASRSESTAGLAASAPPAPAMPAIEAKPFAAAAVPSSADLLPSIVPAPNLDDVVAIEAKTAWTSDSNDFAAPMTPDVVEIAEPSEAPAAESSQDRSESFAPASSKSGDPDLFETKAAWSPEDRAATQPMPVVEDLEPSPSIALSANGFSPTVAPEPSEIEDEDLFETGTVWNSDDRTTSAAQATPAAQEPEPFAAPMPVNSDDHAESSAPAAAQIDSAKTYEMRMRQRTYWTAFDKVLRASDGPVEGGKKPQPQSWMVYGIGRSHFLLNVAMIRAKQQLRVELYISSSRAKAFFYLLKAHKEEIERDLGYSLDWEDLPAEQHSRISISLADADPDNESDWPRQHRWLAQRLNEMHRALSPWVATVDKLAALTNEKPETVKVSKDNLLAARAFDGGSYPEAAA